LSPARILPRDLEDIMKTAILTFATGLALAGAAFAEGHRNASPEGARAYIVSPANGAEVSSPVTIVFGLEGMGVAPAGVEQENTGHHHLLINQDLAEIEMEYGLPATDQVVHFGGGQTQITTDLPAGTHKLQLLLGDHGHVPHNPPVLSEAITITVK
jgi:hypothetical protein